MMQKDRQESTQIVELRERLRQLRESAGVLARQQRDLSDELVGTLQLAAGLSSRRLIDGVIEESVPKDSRPGALRTQLTQLQGLADELAGQQACLEEKLNVALHEAMDFYHAEVEARCDVGGEG